MSKDKLHREYIVSRTINLMKEDVPTLVNKASVHRVMKSHFYRTSPDLYPMFDAFLYSLIEATCQQMENNGIKQPSAVDFLRSFRTINGVSVNIGNLRIDNSIPTDEYTNLIIKKVISKLNRGMVEKVEYKPPMLPGNEKPEDEVDEELEAEFEKYTDMYDQGEEDGEQKTQSKSGQKTAIDRTGDSGDEKEDQCD